MAPRDDYNNLEARCFEKDGYGGYGDRAKKQKQQRHRWENITAYFFGTVTVAGRIVLCVNRILCRALKVNCKKNIYNNNNNNNYYAHTQAS